MRRILPLVAIAFGFLAQGCDEAEKWQEQSSEEAPVYGETQEQCRAYVDENADDGGDGKTWETAFNDLRTTLEDLEVSEDEDSLICLRGEFEDHDGFAQNILSQNPNLRIVSGFDGGEKRFQPYNTVHSSNEDFSLDEKPLFANKNRPAGQSARPLTETFDWDASPSLPSSSQAPTAGTVYDPSVPIPGISPWWNEYEQTDNIYYNYGNVGIGTENSPVKLMVSTADTNAKLDTTYSTMIVEGGEGRLQLAGLDRGASGASLILSNAFNSYETSNWLIDHMTSPYNNRLSFRYGTRTSNGDPYVGSTELMTIQTSGYVGFGAAVPAASVHVYQPMTRDAADPLMRLSRAQSPNCFEQPGLFIDGFNENCGGRRSYALRVEDANHFIWTPFHSFDYEYGLFWATTGSADWKSGDNPNNPNEIIFVGGGQKRASISLADGDAHFNEITATQLTLDSDYWADFVFEDDYNLRSLQEVEEFITQNGHLPDVPSAKEVARDGVSVAKTQATLLQKIEELTLYVIEQNKTIEAQGEQLRELGSLLSEQAKSR